MKILSKVVLGLGLLFSAGLGSVQGASSPKETAASGALETLKVQADTPFDGNAVAPPPGAVAVQGKDSESRSSLTRSGALKADPDRESEAIPPPPQSGSGGETPRRGLKWWVGGMLLALAAAVLLTACGDKPIEKYTPAESCDVTVKAVRTVNEGAFKTDGAAEKAENLAARHFGPGELKGNTYTHTHVSSHYHEGASHQHSDGTSHTHDGEYHDHYYSETHVEPSEYEKAVDSVQYAIRDAEGKIKQASDKINKAAMVAAKCGEEAQAAIGPAKESLNKAIQALAEARETIQAGPNSEAAKEAATKAVALAKEATGLATKAQEIAAQAAASPNANPTPAK